MKRPTSAVLTIGAMVLAGTAFGPFALSQTSTGDAKPAEQSGIAQSAPAPDDSRDERPRPPFRPGDGRRLGGGGGGGGGGGLGPGGAGGFGQGGDGMGGGRGRSGEWRRGDGRGDGPGSIDFDEPSDEEWKEIAAFMEKHSPERLKRLDEIGDEQRQQSVKNMFAARYRAMKDLEQRDPQLHELRLERMKVEDEVFALGWDLARDRFDKPEERDKLVTELRPHLRKLVRNRLRERGLRLKQMEKEIEQQRQQLREDQDEKRVEAAVEANLAEISEERWPRQFRARERRGDPAEASMPAPASPDQ